ncbi:MAG: hypothetical protein ACT4N4_11960 [Rhodospirillales bacterium]
MNTKKNANGRDTMFKTIRPAILSLCLLGFAAAPALADPHWDRDRHWRPYHYPAPRVIVAPAPRVIYAPALSEFELRRTLRVHGFRDIHAIHPGYGVYHVRARDGWGRPVALVVGAYDGRVLSARPAWY